MIDYIFMPKATINVTMVLAIILEKRNALDGVAFSLTYFIFSFWYFLSKRNILP